MFAAPPVSACSWNLHRALKGFAITRKSRVSLTGEEPALPIGEEFDFKIIKMNEPEKKIGLSVRAVSEDEERTRLEDYQRQAAAATTTIEEVMHLKGQGES